VPGERDQLRPHPGRMALVSGDGARWAEIIKGLSFSEVVIEMKGGSRRPLASMARRLLTTPAARAGKVTRWLGRSAPRAGPLAMAAFLAAGVLAAAGPVPAASAATVPP